MACILLTHSSVFGDTHTLSPKAKAQPDVFSHYSGDYNPAIY